jgi:PAS domain S-box-containing protein
MKPPSQFYTLPRLRRSPGLTEFEAVLDFLPNATFLVDGKNKRILLANFKATELTAYTRSELGGMDFTQLFSGLEREALWDKENDGAPFQLTLTQRNKSRVDVHVFLHNLATQGHWILFTLEPSWLVTKREAQQRRRTGLLESMKVISHSLHQIELNDALETMLRAEQELSGATILGIYLQNLIPGKQDVEMVRLAYIGPPDVFPPTLPAQDLVHLRNSNIWSPGKKPASQLHRAVRAAGIDFVASAPLGQRSALIGVLAVAGDRQPPDEYVLPQLEILADAVTALIEKHSREATLQGDLHSEARANALHKIVENSIDDAVVVLTPDLTIYRMNQAAESILGYKGSVVKGQPVEHILIGTESLLPMFKIALDGVPTLKVDNLHLYRRTGEIFLSQLSALPALVDGEIQGAIILFRDLSEREQLQARTQQLEQHASLGEITAIFAHEVRNPINNISTGLQLMAYNLPADDPNQELISRLQTDCDRLSDLMKSVLAYSRSTEYEMEAVDISLLLNRLLERQRSRQSTQNIQMLIQADPNTPRVKGNPRALEQVFNNLITNAIQAMSETGDTISIKIHLKKTSSERRYVAVDVADNGPGIPKELQERIFQPFFTTKSSGTGLGLAITKHILTAHKGTIQVTSFPGGTVFHVQLPVMET